MDKIEEIINLHKKQSLSYKLMLGNNQFHVHELEIRNELTPVTKPTKRGGVYFSDKTIWRIKLVIKDLAVSKYLKNAMLGPNDEFQDIILETTQNNNQSITKIVTNLTNSVQNKDKIELNLVVKDILRT